jgi:hypothetical protein
MINPGNTLVSIRQYVEKDVREIGVLVCAAAANEFDRDLD